MVFLLDCSLYPINDRCTKVSGVILLDSRRGQDDDPYKLIPRNVLEVTFGAFIINCLPLLGNGRVEHILHAGQTKRRHHATNESLGPLREYVHSAAFNSL
jgi:hypothetical protein